MSVHPKLILSAILLIVSSLGATPTQFIFSMGKNYPDTHSILDNAALLGVRVTHYLTPSTALRLGYQHVCESDFKYNPDKDNTPPPGYILNPDYKAPDSSHLDRFFLNAQYDFTIPLTIVEAYVFGGLGYERVYQEVEDLDSQSFVNAGAGIQAHIRQNILFTAELNYIQKFDCDLHDTTVSVGLGYIIDGKGYTTVRTPEEVTTPTPKPSAQTIAIQPAQTLQTKLKRIPKIKDTAHDTATDNAKYYVQLAVATHPNPDYIRKIKLLQEPYVLKKQNGITLLMAGPYKDYRTAKIKSVKLKSIDEGAFVKKLP